MPIDIFIEARKNISASYLKVEDESMSEIRFRTTAKGDLPYLSYIFRKSEPLVTEFRTAICYVTGDLLFNDVQIKK